MSGASLLGGMAAQVTMQALALLPPADIVLKDFRLAYPVSIMTQPHALMSISTAAILPTPAP